MCVCVITEKIGGYFTHSHSQSPSQQFNGTHFIQFINHSSVDFLLFQFKCDRMVGIWLGIYRRRANATENPVELSHYRVTLIPTGPWGFVGNKGAIWMRLKVNGILVSLVCAHMAAGQGKLGKRNQVSGKMEKPILKYANVF